MPFRAAQYQTCRRKKQYFNRGAAERMASLRRPYEVAPLRPYKFPVCELWHLTKMPSVDVRCKIMRVGEMVQSENVVRTLLNAALGRKFS